MKKVLRITNPNDYAAYVNAPPLHPLVCILRYEELGLFRRSLNLYLGSCQTRTRDPDDDLRIIREQGGYFFLEFGKVIDDDFPHNIIGHCSVIVNHSVPCGDNSL